MSVANAARELGLPYHTVYELVQLGHLPVVRPPGSRSLYLDRKDLDAKLEEWKK